MFKLFSISGVLIPLVFSGVFCKAQTITQKEIVNIYPDSVLNDVSNHPIGINLDFLTDDDKYLNPKRKLVDALKAMGVKYLRYPGGNKSDFYFFSKPPYNKAEPTLARTGKGALGGREMMMKNNYTQFKYDVLDFDEYMDICKQVGAEPVIVVAGDEYNVKYPRGSTWSTKEQLIKNAVEWVRYANIKKKYHIKYWLIGNETWNIAIPDGANVYANDVIDFSKAMKAVDPTIRIVPNGNTDAWWKALLTKASGYIDDVCVSNYPINVCDSVKSLTLPADIALASIKKYTSQKDQARLKVIVAEYGPFSWCNNGSSTFVNTMANNLVNMEIGLQLLQYPGVVFSCFWNTRWIDDGRGKFNGFDALNKDGYFNANGYGMMILGKFLGDKMIRTKSIGGLKTYASISNNKHKLFLYILNSTPNNKKISLVIKNYRADSINEVYELVGNGPDDQKPVWLNMKNIPLDKPQTIKGNSVRIVEFQLN